MTCRYFPGVDLSLLDTWSVTVTYPSGGSQTVITEADFSSPKVCHIDLNATIGTHNDLAGLLETELKAIHTGFSCSFNELALTYSISHSTTNFDISFSTAAQRTLGFTAGSTNVASVTSTVRPYYVVDAAHAGRSSYSDRYEPDDVASLAISDSGEVFVGMARTASPAFVDWRQQFETREATFKHVATTAVPWTWQHLFEHTRTVHPLLVKDGYDDSVYHLRPDGSSFKPEPQTPDYDDQWHLSFRTVLIDVLGGGGGE